MIIRRYTVEDAEKLFTLMESEGEEWQAHWSGDGREKYQNALDSSIVYLVFDGDTLCGFVRCRDDDGFGVYVYDLLVDKVHRGKEYGRLLMERACVDYPDSTVYVMSDVDVYYGQKLGYERAGSIFVVKQRDEV